MVCIADLEAFEDRGGLETRIPVWGLTIGMALRGRDEDDEEVFESFVKEELNEPVDEFRCERWYGEVLEGCICICRGDELGEPLDDDDRSEPDAPMNCIWK